MPSNDTVEQALIDYDAIHGRIGITQEIRSEEDLITALLPAINELEVQAALPE